MNGKVPPTASNRRKRELAREGDLVIYKRKRKTIDPTIVVPPNTVESANEGVSEPVPPLKGSEFDTESAQAALGAQPPLPNVFPDSDVNIPIVGGYFESKGATSNEDVGPSDKSLLRNFRFHRARSIALGQVFENNLLQGLKASKALKAGGAGNSLSLKKLRDHYAYKLGQVLSDGTATAAKKKKGLTAKSVAHAYMLYVCGSFLFPTKKAQMSAHASRDDGRQVACCTTLLESWIFAHFPKLAGIPKEMDSDAYEHCTCWKWDASVTDKYVAPALLMFRETLDKYKLEDTSECDLLKEVIEQMKAEIELKRVVDEQCALEFTDLPRQLDVKVRYWSAKIWRKKNTSLEAELRQKFGLEDCNQSLYVELNKKCKEIESLKALAVLQSHQPVPGTTLAKKYKDLLAAHEVIKKKLITKEDFRQKLVNAEERMKSLEANNSEWHKKLVNSEERKKTLEVDNNEWEVWRQALKKTLASEGMGDMGDPTFEELFEQNERFFTIAQQGPKGDYQEDLVSTAVNLENVVIARREKMAKKKKMQELLFQPWMKYLVDVRGVKISNNNSGFRVTAAIQPQSQHRFPDVMKSLKTFLCKDPAFWKSIFSQTLGIQFTADGENAYKIILQVCSYGHQHIEYKHMAHLLATYYEKVVVFISHTEAYTFLPLFWARTRNTTSNEERFQNLVMDTSKYWWFGLGADNHFVRLIPRFDAPIPPLSTIFYSHVNLGIPLGFQKEQLSRYFDVRVRNFKALLKEHKCQGYRVNDMVVVGLSTIK
ncbi:hypothetical protein GIB67_028588 [Kingdonia uniflora]|uniref:Uncharacterized protein n=1 Tax=Kingdonia uniflora TaxID=39325 RepID=A0A7J7KZK3_9MAGN|nr:hypothetical protein GIB67_028588 [Kingdonia uniflora]